MIEVFGLELLQQDQRLSAIISDLFNHDKKCKKLLLLSVKEQVPQQMTTLIENEEREIKLRAIQFRLIEESFLHEDAAKQIIGYWQLALGRKELEETFEIVWERGYCGFQNSKGRMITQYKYDDATNFTKGLARVEISGKYGFINENGNEITPIKYDYNLSFHEGLCCVKFNGKYGFINSNGNEIIPLKYDNVSSFCNGLASVKLNGKCGFIDLKGIEIIPLKYDDAGSFSEGLAHVRLNGESMFIDKKDEIIISSLKYEYIGDFKNDMAPVGYFIGYF